MAARTCKASLAIVETAHSSPAALSHLQVARRVGPEEFNERITRQCSLNALKSANRCISCRALRELRNSAL
jgi:hypothetical protein